MIQLFITELISATDETATVATAAKTVKSSTLLSRFLLVKDPQTLIIKYSFYQLITIVKP